MKKNFFFSIITVIFILFLAEFSLQVLTFISKRFDLVLSRKPRTSQMIQDKNLGFRPSPDYPDHDKNGFRNKYVPHEATIIAMGDSQTYGVGVRRKQAWPYQLEELSRIKTYNMGASGYCPLQSLFLLDEALEMKPKLVIEAFYPGNDLYDAYALAYTDKQFPRFQTKSGHVLENIAKKETKEPLKNEVVKYEIKNTLSRHGGIREFLAEYSKLYGVFRALKRIFENQYKAPFFNWKWIKKEAIMNKDSLFLFENNDIMTVFTPYYRNAALDTKDPRIEEGLRICLEAIKEMNQRLQKENIHFLVLLIPSKALVFKNTVLEHSKNTPEVFRELILNEQTISEKIKDFLKKEGIDFIDPLATLRESLQNHKQPFRISRDVHFNARGHRVVAEFLYEKIKKDHLFQ